MISDRSPSVSSRRQQLLYYFLSRNAAIDITAILQTAVLCDQRRLRIISHAILSRTRGWCYCWNATRARAFQSPDLGLKLKITRSPMPRLFGILWNEGIACSLGWTIVDPTTSYWADYKWSREGALKVANPSSSIIMIMSSISRPLRGQLTAASLLYTSPADPCECLGLHLALTIQYHTARISAVIPHCGSDLCRRVQACGNMLNAQWL